MALSNWDTCAFDADGKPCNGDLIRKFPNGAEASVSLYKNWAYVRDSEMWADGRGYVEPTIAEFNDGRCIVSDFRLYGKRGPQNSILLFAESGWKHSKDPSDKYICMCGIGCYGFSHETEDWVGVEMGTFAALVGFLDELRQDFVVDESYYKLIANADPLRFNQGDGFFAENTDLADLQQVTKIGEAEKPILLQLFDDPEPSDTKKSADEDNT